MFPSADSTSLRKRTRTDVKFGAAAVSMQPLYPIRYESDCLHADARNFCAANAGTQGPVHRCMLKYAHVMRPNREARGYACNKETKGSMSEDGYTPYQMVVQLLYNLV